MSKDKEVKPKGMAGGIPVYCAHDEIVDIIKLIPNPANPNKHPDDQIRLLAKIIKNGGWRQPITVSTRSGYIVKGHGRLMAAQLGNMEQAPVDYQDYASEAEEYADLIADNRIAELSEIDQKMLADVFAEIDTGEIDLDQTGYTDEEVEKLVTSLSEALHQELNTEREETAAEEPPEAPTSQRGDVWILGRHRVMCGDSTSEKDVATLLDGAAPEILVTDPPYCSGGFQESKRSEGSIGTKRYDSTGKEIDVKIANDTLSTRGYQALMKNMLQNSTALVAYIFTDWRMWVYLYDLVESSGLGVKSMIVWDKQTPGMGFGWRAQHELCMFGLKTKPKWDNHKGYGNVIQVARSGNELHPTQKPVELIEKLIDNTAWANGVLDLFGGSGTTLIAAEHQGQTAYLMELTEGYTDVIVRRYAKDTGDIGGVRLIRKGKEVPRSEWDTLLDGIE